MTVIVPNYFIDNEPHNVISSDDIFTVSYFSKKNTDNIAVRNVMHVMILLVEGSKHLQYKNTQKTLNAGDIFFLTQGNYFMREVLSHNGNYKSVMVCFDDTFVLDFIFKYKIDLTHSSKSSVVSFSSSAMLKTLMNSYVQYMHTSFEHKSAIVKLKTEEIFLHLLDENKSMFCSYLKEIAGSSKERVRYVLEANLDLIDSVDDMCKLTRLSKNELRSKMKNIFAMQPKEWLDAKRLEEASLLLKNSNDSISSIASTCGYSTLSWFGVQFKKAYGLSPKVYREQNR